MFSTFKKLIQICAPQLNRAIANQIPSTSQIMNNNCSSRAYHLLLQQPNFQSKLSFMNTMSPSTLTKPAPNTQLIQTCGMKVRGKVHRRCKDCFMVVKHERLYNLCPTHPRHKQMSMKKKPKNTWILTHATQSRIRPW